MSFLFDEKTMFFLFNIVEQEIPTFFGVMYSLFFSLVLILNTNLIIFETEATVVGVMGLYYAIYALDIVCGVFFIIDLLVRVWTSYSSLALKTSRPHLRRIRYTLTFWVAFDVFSLIVQFYYIAFWTSAIVTQ